MCVYHEIATKQKVFQIGKKENHFRVRLRRFLHEYFRVFSIFSGVFS